MQADFCFGAAPFLELPRCRSGCTELQLPEVGRKCIKDKYLKAPRRLLASNRRTWC